MCTKLELSIPRLLDGIDHRVGGAGRLSEMNAAFSGDDRPVVPVDPGRGFA